MGKGPKLFLQPGKDFPAGFLLFRFPGECRFRFVQGFPRAGDLPRQLLQRVIAGQLRLQFQFFSGGGFRLRCFLLLFLQRGIPLFQRSFRVFQQLLVVPDSHLRVLPCLQPAEVFVDLRKSLFDPVFFTGELFLPFRILPDQRFKERQGVLQRQFAVLGFSDLNAQNVRVVGPDAADILRKASACRLPLSPEIAGLPFQPLLKGLKELGLEDLTEDRLPVLGGRQKEP